MKNVEFSARDQELLREMQLRYRYPIPPWKVEGLERLLADVMAEADQTPSKPPAVEARLPKFWLTGCEAWRSAERRKFRSYSR